MSNHDVEVLSKHAVSVCCDLRFLGMMMWMSGGMKQCKKRMNYVSQSGWMQKIHCLYSTQGNHMPPKSVGNISFIKFLII